MGTKEFNALDKLIARMRLGKVISHIKKNDVLLDMGCGYQAYLLTQVQNTIKKGVGIDVDAESRKIGKNIEIRRFHFKDRFPFTDKTFTKITMLALIEHIEIASVTKLFRELSRILKPGGKVVLTTPTPFGKVILEFLAFKMHIISAKEVGDHKKYYEKKDLENLAKNYGFKIESYKTFQMGGNSICVLKK
ncbi:hypothetical protein COY90_01680 [Candidatus Roizmanbacteria bacterium CG_4_10_14_0_8_um_filter_39_9]|uniref:Methyltransferase type 11 domain-containing protein n=1 Tax=Candidatus Roizmanbacteria bacterium CG_4_10_14_0_8_um_filter_39_9 TaxID=1974829 RepID=A0A2M7QEN5_9BACT|nr:MAG: hypothetical protein COY90_01680 [Candidatus Roizmanbacteria bacterium CG_4_10_14_0_8_um_filter_39_9]